MRFPSPNILSFAFLVLVINGLLAQDYLTKDGKLAHQLRIIEQQGGFAGFTGVQFTISPNGAWISESVFNKKSTSKSKGQLSQKDLAKLGAILEKYDLAKLPASSGKQPGANPHTITVVYGKLKARLVGQMPPKLDPKNPTGTIESRFAGIWEGVVGLLTTQEGQRDGQEAEKMGREKLIGVWSGFAVEGKGENPDRGAVKLELTITKDLIKAKQFKGKDILDLGEGTFEIRPNESPNHLDGDKKLDNPNRKEVWLGIYQLEGDMLKWCVGRKTRPTEFETKQGAFLLVLKRKSQ